MAILLTLDYLTGNMALVNVASAASPISGMPGQPIGLLLALTYAA